jgi:hypothetical protein
MVPIDIFMVMVGGVFALMIYSWIDHNNRIYANIIAAFLAATLAGYLGTIVSTNTVYDAWYCTYNETALSHECQEVVFNSPSIGYGLAFISFAMFCYTLYMLWDAYEERKMQKAITKEREGQ